MNEQTIDWNNITYSNYFYHKGDRFAFRKKHLFKINTGKVPVYIPRSNQGWWIGRDLLTIREIEKRTIIHPVVLSIEHLQWFQQVDLQECFNLEKYRRL